jgi:hypothetical protein
VTANTNENTQNAIKVKLCAFVLVTASQVTAASMREVQAVRFNLVTDLWHAYHFVKTEVNISVLFLVTNSVHWQPPFVLLSLSVLLVFITLDASKDTVTHKWR